MFWGGVLGGVLGGVWGVFGGIFGRYLEVFWRHVRGIVGGF